MKYAYIPLLLVALTGCQALEDKSYATLDALEALVEENQDEILALVGEDLEDVTAIATAAAEEATGVSGWGPLGDGALAALLAALGLNTVRNKSRKADIEAAKKA